MRRLYRFVMLAAAGGLVFQAAASCSTEAMNAFSSSMSSAINSAISSQLSSFVSQMFTCTEES